MNEMCCYELSQNAFISLILFYTQINTGLISGSPCLVDELRSLSFFDSLYSYYSRPSVSMGSASVDSTNYGWKRAKKIPESSNKQNLNLLCAGNCLRSIYIVLGITSNLKMI